MILFIPSLHVAWCLPSNFCSRGYMVWMMLDEEFQNGCLVHGHLWYANGVIFAIMSLYVAWRILQRFCSKNRCCLMNNKMAVKFLDIFGFWMKWFYLIWVCVAWCLPSGFCREYMGWKKLFENFQESCLVHDHLLDLSGMKEAFMSLVLTWSIQSSFC